MTEVFNYDWYQTPHVGVAGETLGEAAQSRDLDMKMSNFGALNVGLRMSEDYTRTTLGFKDKDDLSDWSAIIPEAHQQEAEYDDNPYVLGTSLKKVRDDQFVRMGMSMGGYKASAIVNIETAQIDEPSFDVMDTKAVDAAGMSGAGYESIKNYPTEGWKSFGGKYDKPVAYQGW